MTLADLLGRLALGLAVVVDGPRDRPVRWVATSELDDPTPYLDGGELLLTTGLTDHDWAGWVDRLVAADMAAVGFGVGVRHREVPAGLVRAAGRAGLPVLTVPERTPFIAVGEAHVELAAAAELRSTTSALTVQQRMARSAAGSDGPAAVLAILARVLGGDARVVDREGHRLLGSAHDPAPQVSGVLRRMLAGAARVATDVADGRTVVVQTLGSGAERFLATESAGGIDAAGRAALSAAASLLTLSDEVRVARADAEQRVREAVVVTLRAGRPVGDLAAVLGLRVPPRVRALRAVPVPADPARVLRELHDRTGVLGCVAAGGLHVLADAEGPDSALAVDLLVGAGLRVGVGRVAESSDASAVRAALDAADAAAARTSAATPSISWEGYGTRRATSLLDAASGAAFAADVLGEVAGQPELRRTLRVFLAGLGRLRPVAEELGVHRNTLRARLARIEELTGRDLDSAADRTDLWIALAVDP